MAALDGRALRYRQAYHDQVRGQAEDASGADGRPERVGPLLRHRSAGSGWLTYRDLGGLTGAELDALVAAQREHFAAVGVEFEWKYYDYDEPADLPERLAAAGLRPDQPEAVLIGEAADMVAALGADAADATPPGVTLREVTDRVDLSRVAAMKAAVWGGDHSRFVDAWANAAGAVMVVAEAGGTLVSAARLEPVHGTEFAGLWGGATLPGWRRRGIYRALVAHRARRAVELGYRYLTVDASPDSEPILRRLGMVRVATTVPYRWTPQPGWS